MKLQDDQELIAEVERILDDEMGYIEPDYVRARQRILDAIDRRAAPPAVPGVPGDGPWCWHCKAKWPCGCQRGERILATLEEKYGPGPAPTPPSEPDACNFGVAGCKYTHSCDPSQATHSVPAPPPGGPAKDQTP